MSHFTTPCTAPHRLTPAQPGIETPTAPAATHGVLCAKCFEGIARNLARAPGIAEHVAAQIVPGVQAVDTAGATGGSGSASSSSRPPINLGAVDSVDTLWATLANLVLEFAALYKEPAPAAPHHARRGYAGTFAALPAGLDPRFVGVVVAAQAGWLVARLDRIAAPRDAEAAELLGYLLREVRGAVQAADSAFPQADRATFSELPHPGCGGRVGVFPPLGPGKPAARQCERCAEVIDELAWERELVMAGAATGTRPGNQAAGIMRHLSRKLADAAAA
ncbi:hypothetical protein [Cryobacterium sp. PH31-O1]|uniref:hypothetical protein n=1 Tax=Cryobacterium sp. PH31-O1 TaxID=3046306 RepID=UPI0024B8F568|nr:hypothetical protein [Cryobacterium sp. PH31-O1]MDJ0338249.1 hypothetical protein [Cryobacterium sp. PH31-O1]